MFVFLNFTITYYDSSKTSLSVSYKTDCPSTLQFRNVQGWASFSGNKRNYQERCHCSKKQNEHIERVHKNIGTIYKRMNVRRTVIGWKNGLVSFYQERVLYHNNKNGTVLNQEQNRVWNCWNKNEQGTNDSVDAPRLVLEWGTNDLVEGLCPRTRNERFKIKHAQPLECLMLFSIKLVLEIF